MNKSILTIAAMACASVALAQAGGGNPQPPRQGDQQAQMDQIDVAYLGVEASPMNPALKAQLKLTGEDGLVINHVADDGPAKAAGVQQYDILTRLDDQVLYNPHQLLGIVRSKKPGDEVKLTYIRAGEEKTTSIKLGQTKGPRFVGPGVGPMGMAGGGGMGMGGAMPPGFGGAMGGPFRTRAINIDDAEGKLEIRSEAGKVMLSATDKEGKSIYSGEIDTPEQRAKLPESVKTRLNEVALDRMVRAVKEDSRRGPMGDDRREGGDRRGGDRPRGMGPAGEGGPPDGAPREGRRQAGQRPPQE